MSLSTGTTSPDTLFGAAGADTLQGLDGNDQLFGGGGNDLLDGGLGADTLIGGAGNDRYLIDSSSDRVVELDGGGIDTIRSAVALDLAQPWASGIEFLVYTGAAAALLGGNDLDNRLTGGAAGDTLRGGEGADTLDGAGGNDRLEGGLGDDLYLVGAGDLVVELQGEGRDGIVGAVTNLAAGGFGLTIENLFYNGGGATLQGNALDNVISGSAGADTVTGGDGHDSLAGGGASDRVEGGAGDDLLTGAALAGYAWGTPVGDALADTLVGGIGNDTYLVTDLLDVVTEASGEGLRDVVIASVSTALSRYLNVEALVLAEGSGARTAAGSAGNDVILGNAADNLLNGGLGADTLSAWGLAGPAGASPDLVNAGDGADVLVAVSFGGTVLPAAVSLNGGAGNDVYVLGMPGLAVAGSDASGSDTAVLLASANLSQLDGVERIILFGAAAGLTAADWAALGAAQGAVAGLHDLLTGGEAFGGVPGGALNATGTAGTNTMIGNAADNRLAGGGGNDSILGGAGNDSLRGDAGEDSLAGGAGADTLDGGAGNDRLAGGLGNDAYVAETGDTVVEAADAGFDIVQSRTITSLAALANVEGLRFLGTASVTLDAGAGNLTADLLGGGSGNDTIFGRGGGDTLEGAAGNDLLAGQDGNDSLAGGAGDDLLDGSTFDDTLAGGDGADTLDGGANWDSLSGGAGRDVLSGGDGRDTLRGERGDDVIDSGNQDDLVVGGAGADTIYDSQVDTEFPVGTGGDILYGDDTAPGGFPWPDLFVFNNVVGPNTAVESAPGSGVYQYVRAATVADFQSGLDRIQVSSSIGGASLTGTGSATADAAGNFSATASVVFFPTPLAHPLLDDPASGFLRVAASDVDAVIGSASANLTASDVRLFVLNDGANTALFVFGSYNQDAEVFVDELYLIAVVANLPEPSTDDIQLF